MNELIIPQWDKNEYYNTQKPFEWLYQHKDNKFILAQLREKIKQQAGEVGVRNFVALWNSYLEMMNTSKGLTMDRVTEFDGQELELLCGEYVCDDFGITCTDRMGYETIVCNHPIMPIRRMSNIDTGEIKLEIAFRKGKNWRTMVIDKNTLASSQKIVELSKYDVSVDSENAKYLVKYFTEIEHLNYERIPEIHSVGRLGWIEEHGFSPYVDSLKFDGDLTFRSMFNAVTKKGSYKKWLELVKDIRKSGVCARILLAAGFSSVLVDKCNALPFFVHLWGGTEAGKTVGLMLATSIWANPSLGEYIKTFNSTKVGQELTAGFVNSLPLCLDELQVVKEKKDFDELIYMLTEGVGKARGSKGGGLQKTSTWKNCILTTGEQPINNINSGGGAVNRVIDIDCKDEKLFTDARYVANTLKHNYGFAGRIFIEFLKDDEWVKYARDVQQGFYEVLTAGASTEKQAMAASIIMTADKLIDEWIFKDGKTLEISDIEQYLTSKEAVSINERAYEWIIDFTASNPNKFKANEFGDYQGEVWGAIENDLIYFNKTVFDQKMREAGFNATSFLSWAKRKGYIEFSDNRTTKRKRLKGLDRPIWCVCIKSDVSNAPVEDLYLDSLELKDIDYTSDLPI